MMQGKKTDIDRYAVPSVEEAARILAVIAESDSGSLSLLDISARAGIHKSKTFRILHSLNKFRLVQKHDDKNGYSLGVGLISLSRKFLNNLDVRKLADPMLEDLASKAGGTAALGLIEGDYVYVGAKYDRGNTFGIITTQVGNRFPITWGSHGKAIAAAFSKERLDRLLAKDKLYFHGDPQNFDRKRLDKELEQCRKTGYAVTSGDIISGVYSVSSAVLGVDGAPVGYIILFGGLAKKDLRKFGPLVAQKARTLSKEIGYTDSSA